MTYAAVAGEQVFGFATVAVGGVELQRLPNTRLRKRLPAYPLPVIRLARLGVDQRAQGLGVGKTLVRHVFHLALEQRGELGCVVVMTDAKPEAVRFYETLGFMALAGVVQGTLHGEPTPMFLAIGTIAAGTRPR